MNKEELIARIKNAIILLADGYTTQVGDLTFGSRGENHFSVTGWTVFSELKNMSKEAASKELTETKELFWKMVFASTELAAFIKDRQIEYQLAYDYGKGGIKICCETNGQIEWSVELKA